MSDKPERDIIPFSDSASSSTTPKKPDPRDFPFNYLVWFDDDEVEYFECSNYREAEKLIRERYPEAMIEAEFDIDCHQKNFYESKSDFESDIERCGFIERKRDAYDSAMHKWEHEQGIDYPFEDEGEDSLGQEENESDFDECPECGGELDEGNCLNFDCFYPN